MNDPESIMEKIKRVVQDNQTAVLCVQEAGKPFGYLVATAFSENLKFVVFGTPKESRKFRLLVADGKVVAIDAPHRLEMTFHAHWDDDLEEEGPAALEAPLAELVPDALQQ